MARGLRLCARFLHDDVTVSERAEFRHAAEPTVELVHARALLARSTVEPAGSFQQSHSLDSEIPFIGCRVGYMPSSATGSGDTPGGSSSVARALLSRAESTHIKSRLNFKTNLKVESASPVAFQRVGTVADQSTQLQMMCFPRQTRERYEQMGQPGIWAPGGTMSQMTVFELKTISKDYGLGTSGCKADLIGRLRYYLTSDTGYIPEMR